MDDAALRSLLKRLEVLERTAVRARLGEVTDDSPLTVTLGGADTEIASAPHLADASLATGDPVAALTYGNALLVLGRIGDSPAWTPYTPAVTNGSVTLGTGGTITGAAVKIGRTVHVRGSIGLGTGGSISGTGARISLPYTAGAGYQYGTLLGYDASPGVWSTGVAEIPGGASYFNALFTACTGSFTPGFLGASTPWTWAASDGLFWQITYEAAA